MISVGVIDMSRKVPAVVSFLVGLIYFPRVLLNPVLGVFSPLDLSLLRVLFDKLEDDLSKIARSQCDEVNLVRCVTAKTSEINLFKMTAAGFSRERRVVFDRRDYVIASMTAVIAGVCKTNVRFFVVNGCLFSMDFDSDISGFRHESRVEVVDFSAS